MHKTYLLAINSNTKISPDTYELVSEACLQVGMWREANEVQTSCSKPSIPLMECHRVLLSQFRGCNGTENCTGRFGALSAEYVNMSQN